MAGLLQYKLISKFYDLFDLLFLLGGKGNPRDGLLELIPDNSQHILDVCVGTATSSLLVAGHRASNQVLGIDISLEMLTVAERKIARKKLVNLALKFMSAKSIQFADSTFDTVMISFALHEFERLLRDEVIWEISRVLKPGGMFCVVDFAKQEGWQNRAFLKVWRFIEPPCFADFLSIDWHEDLIDCGLHFESQQEYSFSNLYVLRKQ
jgi:ubiquinone/menaquinone biosynthesis C-methylase UbiE